MDVFKCKDIDIICILRFKGHEPICNPILDPSGIRYVAFNKTKELVSDVMDIMNGTKETDLLTEFRKTRSFILDSTPICEDK